MKKILTIIAGIMIIGGLAGGLSSVSTIYKTMTEENQQYYEPYGLFYIQMLPGLSIFVYLIIGGSLLLAVSAFLKRYEDRTSIMESYVHTLVKEEPKPVQSAVSQAEQETIALFKQEKQKDVSPGDTGEDDRYYWKG
ncbi:hypothetical protein [Metabacillus indicus]|uniref:Uncharacterized protein n=1 Tax=Metabacillus indicus TaxID=246786 RepID=A0A084GNV0_METID|nr:hypothetical protein [Metabacillus indicus]KEZ49012.1 hypothetical protein GS18_0216515 [Metabacillus indicus]